MVELIKPVDPKFTVNEYLGVLPIGIPTERITSTEGSKSWHIQKHEAAKLVPTWQSIDILSSLKLLNALTALKHSWRFPYLCYLQPKEYSSRKLVQSWTWIAGPFQGFNLKGW